MARLRLKRALFSIAIVVSIFYGLILLGIGNGPVKEYKKPIVIRNTPIPIKTNRQPPVKAKPITVNKDNKLILLWTPFFRDPLWREDIGIVNNSDNVLSFRNPIYRTDPSSYYPDRKCQLTTDKSLLSQSDAVIFHCRDLRLPEFPKERLPKQRWIIHCLESASNLGTLTTAMRGKLADTFKQHPFNWTMGFYRNADVYFPYGLLYKRHQPMSEEEKSRIDTYVNSFSDRSGDGIWIASSCKSGSKREYLVSHLENAGIKVVRFGNCSKEKIRPEKVWKSEQDVKNVFTDIGFYFSFENSICPEYVTEKAYMGYYANWKYGNIPIFYGGAKYSEMFPPDSYIDATYMKPDDLVELIRKLKKPENKHLVRKYFDWQFDYEMFYNVSDKDHFYEWHGAKIIGWQTLCERLWTAPQDSVDTIDDIGAKYGTCWSNATGHAIAAAETKMKNKRPQILKVNKGKT